MLLLLPSFTTGLKKCEIGWSCGNTCISRTKQCLKQLLQEDSLMLDMLESVITESFLSEDDFLPDIRETAEYLLDVAPEDQPISEYMAENKLDIPESLEFWLKNLTVADFVKVSLQETEDLLIDKEAIKKWIQDNEDEAMELLENAGLSTDPDDYESEENYLHAVQSAALRYALAAAWDRLEQRRKEILRPEALATLQRLDKPATDLFDLESLKAYYGENLAQAVEALASRVKMSDLLPDDAMEQLEALGLGRDYEKPFGLSEEEALEFIKKYPATVEQYMGIGSLVPDKLLQSLPKNLAQEIESQSRQADLDQRLQLTMRALEAAPPDIQRQFANAVLYKMHSFMQEQTGISDKITDLNRAAQYFEKRERAIQRQKERTRQRLEQKAQERRAAEETLQRLDKPAKALLDLEQLRDEYREDYVKVMEELASRAKMSDLLPDEVLEQLEEMGIRRPEGQPFGMSDAEAADFIKRHPRQSYMHSRSRELNQLLESLPMDLEMRLRKAYTQAGNEEQKIQAIMQAFDAAPPEAKKRFAKNVLENLRADLRGQTEISENITDLNRAAQYFEKREQAIQRKQEKKVKAEAQKAVERLAKYRVGTKMKDIIDEDFADESEEVKAGLREIADRITAADLLLSPDMEDELERLGARRRTDMPLGMSKNEASELLRRYPALVDRFGPETDEEWEDVWQRAARKAPKELKRQIDELLSRASIDEDYKAKEKELKAKAPELVEQAKTEQTLDYIRSLFNVYLFNEEPETVDEMISLSRELR